jgi:hypothetical protein
VPTIFRVFGLRFFFYNRESGEPPHVHSSDGSKAAQYWSNPVKLAGYEGFRGHELNRLRVLVIEHHDTLRRSWDEYHGRQAGPR